LLYQESQREGIEVKEATVDQQFGRIKSRFPTEAEFERALNQMNLSEAAMRSQITRDMAIQQLIDQEFGAKVTISDKESRSYYDEHPSVFKQPEQVRASHVLIKVDPQADESHRATARKEIEAIQERLRKGEDFAALAKEASQCPSAAKGGDLG
jgi:peptidyl-prolyl cis-trans isomerase C